MSDTSSWKCLIVTTMIKISIVIKNVRSFQFFNLFLFLRRSGFFFRNSMWFSPPWYQKTRSRPISGSFLASYSFQSATWRKIFFNHSKGPFRSFVVKARAHSIKEFADKLLADWHAWKVYWRIQCSLVTVLCKCVYGVLLEACRFSNFKFV